MANPSDEKRYDVRLIEARIRRGSINHGDYRRFLESLPDDAENGEPSRVTFVDTFARRSNA